MGNDFRSFSSSFCLVFLIQTHRIVGRGTNIAKKWLPIIIKVLEDGFYFDWGCLNLPSIQLPGLEIQVALLGKVGT